MKRLPMRSSGRKSDPQDPRAEMKMRKPEEDVLDVIESVESQLVALRKAHEEHKRAMQALNDQARPFPETVERDRGA